MQLTMGRGICSGIWSEAAADSMQGKMARPRSGSALLPLTRATFTRCVVSCRVVSCPICGSLLLVVYNVAVFRGRLWQVSLAKAAVLASRLQQVRAGLPLNVLADAIDARAEPAHGTLTAAALQLVVADVRAAWRGATNDAHARLCRTCVLVFDLCCARGSPVHVLTDPSDASVDDLADRNGQRLTVPAEDATVPATRVLGVLAALAAAAGPERLALVFSIAAEGAAVLTTAQLARMVPVGVCRVSGVGWWVRVRVWVWVRVRFMCVHSLFLVVSSCVSPVFLSSPAGTPQFGDLCLSLFSLHDDLMDAVPTAWVQHLASRAGAAAAQACTAAQPSLDLVHVLQWLHPDTAKAARHAWLHVLDFEPTRRRGGERG